MSKDREPEHKKMLVIITTDGFIRRPPDICREILQELKDRETPRKSHIPWLYELDAEETEKTWEKDESKHTFEKPADDAGRFW